MICNTNGLEILLFSLFFLTSDVQISSVLSVTHASLIVSSLFSSKEFFPKIIFVADKVLLSISFILLRSGFRKAKARFRSERTVIAQGCWSTDSPECFPSANPSTPPADGPD